MEDDATYCTRCCGNNIHKECYARCIHAWRKCPMCRNEPKVEMRLIYPPCEHRIFLKHCLITFWVTTLSLTISVLFLSLQSEPGMLWVESV